MTAIWRFISGRRTAWIVLVGTIVAVGLLFSLLPKSASNQFPSTGLPTSSQAAQVDAALAKFPSAEQTAAILVWSRGDATLTAADRTANAERATARKLNVLLHSASGSPSSLKSALCPAVSTHSRDKATAEPL